MSETYPKMLYRGGQAYDPETGKGVAHQHTLTVNDAAEEEAAAADGFSPAELPEAPEPEPVADGGDETTEGHDGDETLGGADGDDTLSGAEGHDDLAGAEAADEQHPADAASV